MFAAFRRKIINSVLTFKKSLLAFNHCEKLLRSWFNFLAKTFMYIEKEVVLEPKPEEHLLKLSWLWNYSN